MKIAIISDIHDNHVNLNKFLNWSRQNKVEEIICCGDVTNSETLDILADFEGKIHLVQGNIELYDKEELKKYRNILDYGQIGCFSLSGKKIGLVHKRRKIDSLLKKDKFDIVFYGHSHKPWEEERAGVKILNPGTLGGMFQKSTFAVWELPGNKFKLILAEELND